MHVCVCRVRLSGACLGMPPASVYPHRIIDIANRYTEGERGRGEERGGEGGREGGGERREGGREGGPVGGEGREGGRETSYSYSYQVGLISLHSLSV